MKIINLRIKINKVIDVPRNHKKKMAERNKIEKFEQKNYKINCSTALLLQLIVMIIKCPHDLMVNNTIFYYEMQKNYS